MSVVQFVEALSCRAHSVTDGKRAMGYDLHITRAKFHFENEGAWITADEWLRYVESDPDLKLAGYNGEYFALWSGKSEYPDPWLDWFQGNIYTQNRDAPLIDKMVEIAKKLDAKVQGDDGETYIGGGPNDSPPCPEHDLPKHSKQPKRSWFRRLLSGDR
jgi:hypothetical protein